MSRVLRHCALAVIVAWSALVSGCSDTTSDPTGGDSASAADAVTIEVRIDSGTVTPTNERTEAKVNQPIVVRVDSDASDELHVHSDPAHTFPVERRAGQKFRFTVTVPGSVDIELHDAGKTVTTLLIRP
ncbi:hypothetical protein HLB23_01615 [Nocardia uniformis]|uniref:EfeO-type cupredoxin-like domain-containing protein n=1 Tax=Nocardia uniformis TaxID=53432 RepID=A0A849BWC2_9NOCA|nr:hypothetical protein [Nocardia uniformis]NNH68590.1 hypothetical protein [Nocardia uniformis]